MTIAHTPPLQFASLSTKSKGGTVDLTATGKMGGRPYKGVIRGYAVASVGEALGWGIELDATTLDQIAALGNAQKRGVKSRFTHSLGEDALGTFLGRSFDFRVDGDVVRADLYLSPTAYNTPYGDLAGYVASLANNDPDAFGASAAVRYGLEYRITEDGSRAMDVDGNYLLPLCRAKLLRTVDIVDDPATNDSFFSSAGPSSFHSAAGQLFDRLFASRDRQFVADHLAAFTHSYLSHRYGDSASMSTAATDTKQPEKTLEPVKTATMGQPIAAELLRTEEARFSQADLDAAAKKAVEALLGTATKSAVAEAQSAEFKRVSTIVSLCKAAGMSDKAEAWVNDATFSVDKAREQLLEAMWAKTRPPAARPARAKARKPPIRKRRSALNTKRTHTCTRDSGSPKTIMSPDASSTTARPSSPSSPRPKTNSLRSFLTS